MFGDRKNQAVAKMRQRLLMSGTKTLRLASSSPRPIVKMNCAISSSGSVSIIQSGSSFPAARPTTKQTTAPTP